MEGSTITAKLYRRIIMITLAWLFIVAPLKIFAQLSTATNTPDSASAILNQSAYVFIAQPGDSLSIMVRRALQLHLRLTPSAALYCEDKITKAQGANLLEVGQRVEVNFNEIDECSLASQSLSQEQQTAWLSYSSLVTFDIDYIQPIYSPKYITPVSAGQTPVMVDSEVVPKIDNYSAASKSIAIKKIVHISNWWYVLLGLSAMFYYVFSNNSPKKNRQ